MSVFARVAEHGSFADENVDISLRIGPLPDSGLLYARLPISDGSLAQAQDTFPGMAPLTSRRIF
jgi:hypothetical protein